MNNSTAYLDKVMKVGSLQADGHTQSRIADMLASWGGSGRMSQLNQAYSLLTANEDLRSLVALDSKNPRHHRVLRQEILIHPTVKWMLKSRKYGPDVVYKGLKLIMDLSTKDKFWTERNPLFGNMAYGSGSAMNHFWPVFAGRLMTAEAIERRYKQARAEIDEELLEGDKGSDATIDSLLHAIRYTAFFRTQRLHS